MTHKRVNIGPDDRAIQALTGNEYKIMHYLINRADSRGICFPSVETISEATRTSAATVYRALEKIQDMDLMRYVRRDEYDMVSKKKKPNAYQICPEYLSLPVKFVLESQAIWGSLTGKFGNRSSYQERYINQQPIPLTNTIGPDTKRTNTNNQYHSPLNAEKLEDASSNLMPEGEDHTLKILRDGGKAEKHPPENEGMDSNQQPAGQSPSKSSVPPAREKYTNPDPITANLPDQTLEILAYKIRQLGIAMPQARGFVMTYGVERCTAAIKSVESTSGVKSPAGLFRSIIQNGLADDYAAARQKIFSDRRA